MLESILNCKMLFFCAYGLHLCILKSYMLSFMLPATTQQPAYIISHICGIVSLPLLFKLCFLLFRLYDSGRYSAHVYH